MTIGAARVARAGGVPAPRRVGDLAHWYDATELSGFDDGDSVGTWPDEEDTDDLAQGTGSAQPTYQTGIIGGKPIVRFDGTDDYMDVDWADISEPFQFFTVHQWPTAGEDTNETMLDGLTNIEHRFGKRTDNTRYINQGSINKGSAYDANPHIGTFTFRSGTNNDELRIDGTQDINTDAGNASSTGFTVGSNGGQDEFGGFDIGEIIFYTTELSTTDRDAVESYLSDKWGIAI